MNFSQRGGYKKPVHNPVESMDGRLKNAIWTLIYNYLDKYYISWGSYGSTTYIDGTKAENLWADFFEQNVSKLPNPQDFLSEVDELYSGLAWNEIYDLLEFLLENDANFRADKINTTLSKYNAAYRVIDSIIQPISDKKILEIIELANINSPSKENSEQLRNAEKLYSHKQTPAFNSSCLESIKAKRGC